MMLPSFASCLFAFIRKARFYWCSSNVSYIIVKNPERWCPLCSTNAELPTLRPRSFPNPKKPILQILIPIPVPISKRGDPFLLKRTTTQDVFHHLMNGRFCGEAWDTIGRYVHTPLQCGSIMHGWTSDDRTMIACCNYGTRPVIFFIERIDILETEE